MEELKPKIKPKAPASLKQNVLRAIQQEGTSQPRTRFVSLHWISAAAILLIGILTFTLLPKENKPLAHVKEKIHHETPYVQVEQKNSSLSPTLAQTTRQAKTRTKRQYQTRKNKTIKALVFEEIQTTEINEITQEEMSEDKVRDDIPSVESPQMELTPYERQLIENMEKHSDLVRACLAEELMQAAFKQTQVVKLRQDYLQNAIQLYDSINKQIQKGFFDIKQPVKKVIRQA